jgi:hypothetical protein
LALTPAGTALADVDTLQDAADALALRLDLSGGCGFDLNCCGTPCHCGCTIS